MTAQSAIARFPRAFAFLGLVLALIAATPATAEVPGPVVDADWLAEHIDDQDVIVLDVRKDLFTFTKAGHIPGAVLVNSRKVRVNRTVDGVKLEKMLPDRAYFQAFMRRHGVDAGSTIVITNQGEKAAHVTEATRFYWQIRYFGHDNVAMLDGGNAAWADGLGDLTDAETAPRPAGDWTAGPGRPGMVATTADVDAAIRDSGVQLVDTRVMEYFVGLRKKTYVYASGHIPGSVMFPYPFATAIKGPAKFLDGGQAKVLAASLGIDLAKPVILYCNSGNLATANWFVLTELMGKTDVVLYDGSMHEWTKDDRRPVTTAMMR